MSDNEHLPVRPNIGVQNNNMRMRQKANDHTSAFNNSIDPDLKHVINKNGSIDNESQITREERISKGVKTLRSAEKKSKESKDEEPKNQWSSWIIISLAVIIIVLIIIIIYYVIQYNTTILDKTIIPESVVRPSHMHMQPMQTISQIPHQAVYQNTPPIQNTPAKPKNFVDPTKNDLMAALNEFNKTKLEPIIEAEEPAETVKPDEPKQVKPSVNKPAENQFEKIVELPDEPEEEDDEKLMEKNNTDFMIVTHGEVLKIYIEYIPIL
jgi:cytoskeletal protein RodZ